MKKKGKQKTAPQGRKLDWEEYSKLCKLIAKRARDEADPDAVVGIAKGGVIVGATVSSLLNKDFFPIKFSRRVNDKVVRKRPKLIVPPTAHIEGKKVLLLDDLSRSGETIHAAVRQIKAHRPAEIITAVLVRQGDYSPDYYAIYSPDKIAFPWQMDEDENAADETGIPK